MKKRVIGIIGGLLLLLVTAASLGVGIYYFRQYRMIASDSTKAEEVQTQMILDALSRVIDLPHEKPSVVTITDREQLQNQPFFQKALNGDKIIIFREARRVILYRPSTGKIIDMVPLVFNVSPTPEAAPQTEEIAPKNMRFDPGTPTTEPSRPIVPASPSATPS